MKDVKISYKPPVFRVSIQGAPPANGWLVQYISGIEDRPEVKIGSWLADWKVDGAGEFSFYFDPGQHASFDTKEEATAVSNEIRDKMHIVTRVVGFASYK
jgi:hypothetical protein